LGAHAALLSKQDLYPKKEKISRYHIASLVLPFERIHRFSNQLPTDMTHSFTQRNETRNGPWADLGYPTLVGHTPTIDFLTFMSIPLCSGHIQN
jgi:hypothetical protein